MSSNGKQAKHVFTGIWTYAEFTACLLAFMPPMAVSYLRHKGDPTMRAPGQWMRRLGRTASRFTPLWKFTIEGERPADIDTRGYVVIANHESQADPFLLSWLPFDMRWVAKEELFKPPVVGWAMTWGGDIPLRRGEGDSVRKMLDECARAIEAGISVMLFPEGTRTRDGSLLPFKDGAFSLAIRTGAPILPVALTGTREMRPAKTYWFGKARARARILDPIPTTGLTLADVPKLREQAREAIRAALGDMRGEPVKLAEPRPSPPADAHPAS
ncbi:MAG: 1-acyl-sn-glycerol-3-phosphate acyltransferase [Labilithrix sp.]|nr:1-acyl-sn-glycerol-3-phosphate acyltransferase [Labilithrix sp.]MCW5816690.1 1-acyl-sn-glycerol-3-phosphate acyltransferase [Labilithrix sp.]